MTEPLSGIDSYENISLEIGAFAESLTYEERKLLEETGLAIFGPEVILGREYRQILRKIYDSGMFVADFLIGVLREEQIELLYKYHVPDSLLSTPELKEADSEIKDYAHLIKTVPVRHWRLLRRRYALGPSLVAILCKPGQSATAALKALKGPSDPADTDSDSLRSIMDNPCFCRIHSSDDAASVIREARIFFGTRRLHAAIRRNGSTSYERLVDVLDANVSDSQEFRSPIIFLRIKLRLLYLSRTDLQPLETIYKRHLTALLSTRCGPELLWRLTQCTRDEQRYFAESDSLLDEVASALLELSDPKRFRSTGITELMKSDVMETVYMSEQERLLFETAIAYYRDFDE